MRALSSSQSDERTIDRADTNNSVKRRTIYEHDKHT